MNNARRVANTRLLPIVLLVSSAHALKPTSAPVTRPTLQQAAAAAALSLNLAAAPLALNAAAHAAAPPPALERTTTTLLADEELRPEQVKFLEDRAKLKQQYESQVESTYKTEEETQDKKITYTTVVGGLIAVAFIAPMVQFFYYTGGE